jgi:hypothetical protein
VLGEFEVVMNGAAGERGPLASFKRRIVAVRSVTPANNNPRGARKPRTFVAVPCGDFYSVQADIIREVCSLAGVDCYIAEDSPDTKGLWDSISAQIDTADVFIADISSASPNILLEVGYAIGRKPIGAIGLFLAKSVTVPSDLRWVVVQVYSSLSSFRNKLGSWLEKSLPLAHLPRVPTRHSSQAVVFAEDFMNDEDFLRRWATPPGCSYLLGAEGMRFSNAHFPILTTPLAIVEDCEFEFWGRIDREQIGWAVRGTKAVSDILPSFCVVFTLNVRGELTPHIWSVNNPHAQKHYQVFPRKTLPKHQRPVAGRWSMFVTRLKGNVVEIEVDGRQVFAADLSRAPFASTYLSVSHRQGQVGFRCHPGEEATVRAVRVRALDRTGGLANKALQPTSRAKRKAQTKSRSRAARG